MNFSINALPEGLEISNRIKNLDILNRIVELESKATQFCNATKITASMDGTIPMSHYFEKID